MKARLVYYHKAKIQRRYILALTIYDVGKSDRYVDGIKYSLICCDVKTKTKVLLDNHHPKGHHVHLDEKQIRYAYKTVDGLIADFKQFVLNHMGVKL
jgi:hypothetical protein